MAAGAAVTRAVPAAEIPAAEILAAEIPGLS
jgi:hypothetical protein